MTPRLMLLAAQLLDMARAEFANHGCNDFDLPADFTDADREALASLMNRANFRDRPPETWPADDVMTIEDLRAQRAPDFAVMGALAFGLRKDAEVEA